MFVTLTDSDRWLEFHVHNNEMRIAKLGRSMFPRLAYEFHGLDPNGIYFCSINFELMSASKLKLKDGQWVDDGRKKEEAINNITCYTSKPLSGVRLMTEGISYSKLKLTNCPRAMEEKGLKDYVHLESQMRYIPVLSLWQIFEGYPNQLVGQFRFEQTEFVTVTAYQSKKILEMKKLNNDYAASFRDGKVEKREKWGEVIKRKMEEKENQVSKRGKLDSSLGEDSEKDGEEVGQVQYPPPVQVNNDQQFVQQPYQADQMKDQLSWTWQGQQDYGAPQMYQPQYDGAYQGYQGYQDQGYYDGGYMFNPYNY